MLLIYLSNVRGICTRGQSLLMMVDAALLVIPL
jgi:hypothetical protein